MAFARSRHDVDIAAVGCQQRAARCRKESAVCHSPCPTAAFAREEVQNQSFNGSRLTLRSRGTSIAYRDRPLSPGYLPDDAAGIRSACYCRHQGLSSSLAPTTRNLKLAAFIVLKRPGPPSREVLVNLDQILMVQPGQNTGSAILFGKEHLVNFEEDLPTVIRRIQTGPFVRTDQG